LIPQTLREGSHIFDIQPDVRLETFSLRENKSSKALHFSFPAGRKTDRSIATITKTPSRAPANSRFEKNFRGSCLQTRINACSTGGK
jgi:hypothetical protein